MMPITGNTNLLTIDKDPWLPTTVEVIVAEQDMMLSDFIANGVKPAWALDPLELETSLNSNPGVISWSLMLSAPGGYERALFRVTQLLLMLSSFLILFVPAYVWQDARGRYRGAPLWTAAVALTNIVGLLAYLLFGRVTATSCYECGQAVNDQQKFCPYCRVHLKAECLNCGQPLGRNWRYCAICGTKPNTEN